MTCRLAGTVGELEVEDVQINDITSQGAHHKVHTFRLQVHFASNI